MRIISTVYQLENIHKLSVHADGFLIGNNHFGTRLTRSFSTEEILKMLEITQKLNKSLFIVANQMFDDEQLEAFKIWIENLPISEFSGVIVADLGAFRILESMGLGQKIIYNPETLMTNAYDFNFLSEFQIQGVYVAKEITLDDIRYIGERKKYQMFMVGHGHLNMFYSKRQLIDNFMYFIESDNPYHNRQDLKIIEENRKEDPYPILEDEAGTHVFRSQVFSSLFHLNDLKEFVDYLVIDTLFKDDDYAFEILKMYKTEKVNTIQIEKIKNKYQEIWDEGFFYKKTIYQHKG
ncbi:MAG: U32 family peptidase [Firmicutes bacterium]|nr:U32 family peptidase [Bacillota bacterium]